MFRIKVHCSAPDHMHHMDFWCKFFEGTHWRKFNDNAEIVIEKVDKIDLRFECVCKAFNDKYNVWGTQVRDFPFGYSFLGDRVDIESICKHGFHLIPDKIQRNSFYLSDDSYSRKMNNLGYGDSSLKRVDTDYNLKGMNSGRPDEPVALFNLGIPAGRVVSIKGLLIGNESGATYSYYDVGY